MGANSLTDIISAAANLGLFVLACFAVYVALRQIGAMKEVEAYNAYDNYHRFIFENPELSDGNFDFASASEKDRFQYETLLMLIMLTIERVMPLVKNKPDWDAAFEDDLNLHKRYLCSAKFGEFIGNLNPQVVQLIERTATKYNWDYPYKNWKRPS